MNLYNSETYLTDIKMALSNSIGVEQLKGKKILITGATGTIGSFLVDCFLEYNEIGKADITIYAAARSRKRLVERFGKGQGEKLVFVEYDIHKAIEFDFDVEYIIHAAGNAYPAAFNSDPVGTITGNVNGTLNLLNYAGNHGTNRFLYVSSGEVYGQGKDNIVSFEETYSGYVDPISPRSCYPLSKRVTETLCVSYTKEYGLDTIIARPCHTYGPSITENDNRANAQFIRNAIKKRDIVLNSLGSQIRSYCYVPDCASALITILVKGKSREAYNCANPKAVCSIAEFARSVGRIAGCNVLFDISDKNNLRDQTPITRQVLNVNKLESIGWRGCFSIEDGIAHTLKILSGE